MTQSTQPAAHPEGLSMLDKRRIEAEILKEVYQTLKASHGEEVAKRTIAESVRRSAIEQARAFAAAAPGGTSLKAFQDVMPLWTKGGALEIEIKEQTDSSEIRIESFYGNFSRSFSLPDNIDAKGIRAETKDGVLRVKIPKMQAAVPKTVSIEVK